MKTSKEIVIGISGASGVQYGIRLLKFLHGRCFTHLILTDEARTIMSIETDTLAQEVESLADRSYGPMEFSAPIASGSYAFDAMVIVPCSMKTLASVAHGISDSLLTRTADVCLKERRRLVLVTREMPLSLIHLKNMQEVTQAGAVVMPACPPYYSRPASLDEIADVVVGRALDLLEIEHNLFPRWGGNPYNDTGTIGT